MLGPSAITVVVLGALRVSDENVRLLRTIAPEIGSVELVASGEQLCAEAAVWGRVVGIVDAGTPGLPAVAERFRRVAEGGLLAVAVHPNEAQVKELFACGVMGVVLTSGPAEELITAVRAISAGHMFVPPQFLPVLAETVLRNPYNERARELRGLLTEREMEVLMLLAGGRTNPEIAGQLGISVATVRSHVLTILRKMKVPNRTVAAICAYRSGLVGV
ncbi:response regulator transcription factor [Kutzneria buriramensis]|uniref:Two-component system response regulator NreC n=1 Tax=Kutzneria buriramensis TaxID=1045776 RepID=A0A3E0GTK1_9PSEU|nr:response regulator transcription factor [Kutzneria buriramensis]REH27012.1 two-component system response regulator NreC [Kutzneria buriramensis]